MSSFGLCVLRLIHSLSLGAAFSSPTSPMIKRPKRRVMFSLLLGLSGEIINLRLRQTHGISHQPEVEQASNS